MFLQTDLTIIFTSPAFDVAASEMDAVVRISSDSSMDETIFGRSFRASAANEPGEYCLSSDPAKC